ncbi:MAG TPA: sigma-70 family RNA polymerase sigma factor [Candidatus Dormibacteraeota bacterium]|nr:sigma-70 family RNA polymerase sigma factor [Candidatus Dormibacteraeota bacterium]
MTAELLDRLATDLDDAFPELVAAYESAVFATALRLCGHWQDAEDAAQETFVRAYAALGSWTELRIRELRVRPWLVQICLNAVRNRARSTARRPRQAPLDDGVGVRDPSPGPEAEAGTRETRAALEVALGGLPDLYRRPVVLRHVTGLGYAEIAEVLGLPAGTVKAQVHRGVRMLATALQGTTAVEEAG